MKKIGLLFREISENLIKDKLKESSSVLIVTYSKVSSPDLSTLRQSLRNTRATFFMVKNNIARRALKNSGLGDLIKLIEGPCGLVFVKEEPRDASRVLYNFSREHESIKIEGGFLKDKILDRKDIEILARLPSKEVLRIHVVLALKSPISSLVNVLDQIPIKFVYCLEQIKQKIATADAADKKSTDAADKSSA